MPLMTKPLAHIEGVLGTVEFDLDQIKRERMKLDAKFEALNDFRERLRCALDDEREKLAKPDPIITPPASPDGDKHAEG